LREDSHKEPRSLIAALFFGGMLSVVAAIFCEKLVAMIVVDQNLQYTLWAAIEEILKLKSNSQTVEVFKHDIAIIKQEYGNDLELYAKKKEKYCSDRIKRVMFEKYLIQIKNQREGVSQINKYFNITADGVKSKK
jgi:hypothetical protein